MIVTVRLQQGYKCPQSQVSFTFTFTFNLNLTDVSENWNLTQFTISFVPKRLQNNFPLKLDVFVSVSHFIHMQLFKDICCNLLIHFIVQIVVNVVKSPLLTKKMCFIYLFIHRLQTKVASIITY